MDLAGSDKALLEMKIRDLERLALEYARQQEASGIEAEGLKETIRRLEGAGRQFAAEREARAKEYRDSEEAARKKVMTAELDTSTLRAELRSAAAVKQDEVDKLPFHLEVR